MVTPSNQYDDDCSNDQQSSLCSNFEDFDTTQYYEEDRYLYRASTAPARPLTEIEEFRRSREFLLLEKAVILSSQLIQRSNNKYDLDSPEGQRSCKRFLKNLEQLHEAFKTRTASRKYRYEFSRAYKILYKEGSLCYLTEILDSAQEAFPYLYVNGEKYLFSGEVLEAGKKLFNSFCEIQPITRNAYTRACHETSNKVILQIKMDFCRVLEDFDYNWVTFEQRYVFELMLIEAEARRFISDAIETENELKSLEIREKAKGRILLDFPEYHKVRNRLAKQISQLNGVANTEGKGRDDLDVEILISAEGIMRRISPDQSKAVRIVAEQIRNSFMNLRQLLRKYEQNIDIVDPQLRNNPELVQALAQYETSWEKGKFYFLNGKICNQLIHFSQIIEGVSEKYKEFQEQIESRDADIFFSIPCLLILKSLENNDKGICKFFLPEIDKEEHKLGKIYAEIREIYLKECKGYNYYDYYNYVERLVLNIPETTRKFKEETHIEKLMNNIKNLSIELQRSKPTDWNNFMDVLLGSY